MIRRSSVGAATGIMILSLAGLLVAATGPVGTPVAAKGSTAPSTRQAANRQGDAAGPGCTAAKPGSSTSRDLRPEGMYTVTAINGQTITATTAGMGFTVTSSGNGTVTAGGMGGGIVTGGSVPMPAPGQGPAASGPGPVSTAPMTVTITVSSSTTYTRADHTASLSDVQVGSLLRVEGTQSGTTISASAVDIVLPRLTGVVTAVNGSSLTVTGFDARAYTIVADSNTVYHRAGQTAALSNIAAGSLISAEGTLSSAGSTLDALSVTIQLPSVAGKVTAISGNTVTVRGPDGTTSTVLLTGTTTYSGGSQATAGKSSIATGSFILAEGPIGSDGSMTALLVAIATTTSANGSTCESISVPGGGAAAGGSGFAS